MPAHLFYVYARRDHRVIDDAKAAGEKPLREAYAAIRRAAEMCAGVRRAGSSDTLIRKASVVVMAVYAALHDEREEVLDALIAARCEVDRRGFSTRGIALGAESVRSNVVDLLAWRRAATTSTRQTDADEEAAEE